MLRIGAFSDLQMASPAGHLGILQGKSVPLVPAPLGERTSDERNAEGAKEAIDLGD